MKLRAFRVHMYRPILDSGWVNVDDITPIIGKNESGKTALLKALHKLRPFKDESYSLDREWPRGHRLERSPSAVVVRARFAFENHDLDEIIKRLPGEPHPDEVEISKSYDGTLEYTFYPIETYAIDDNAIAQMLNDLGSPSTTSSEFSKLAISIRDEAVANVETSTTYDLAHQTDAYKTQLEAAVQDDIDREYATLLCSFLERLISHKSIVTAKQQLEEIVFDLIPTFIYMDDYRPFRGSAHLDQVHERQASGDLTEEDKTFLMLMDLSGLNFEEEVSRSTDADREQRMLDMNDASLALTRLLASHWSQRKYEVRLSADGNHIIAFVSDIVQPALVPLDERSRGFSGSFLSTQCFSMRLKAPSRTQLFFSTNLDYIFTETRNGIYLLE